MALTDQDKKFVKAAIAYLTDRQKARRPRITEEEEQLLEDIQTGDDEDRSRVARWFAENVCRPECEARKLFFTQKSQEILDTISEVDGTLEEIDSYLG